MIVEFVYNKQKASVEPQVITTLVDWPFPSIP